MAPAARTATRRTASAKPAEPEVVETEEEEFEDVEDDETTTDEDDEATDDDDLEELEEDEEPEEAPKPKARKATKSTKTAAPKQEKIAFGSAELAAHVTEVTNETYDARGIRMLLRKLAKDEEFQRAVGEDRSRYSFEGPGDPVVKLVVQMVKSGAAKALKQEGLQKVKDEAAKKKAAAKLAKEAQAEVDEDEMEVEEEAPKPRRRTATKTAAPAKATPSTKGRRAAAAKS